MTGQQQGPAGLHGGGPPRNFTAMRRGDYGHGSKARPLRAIRPRPCAHFLHERHLLTSSHEARGVDGGPISTHHSHSKSPSSLRRVVKIPVRCHLRLVQRMCAMHDSSPYRSPHNTFFFPLHPWRLMSRHDIPCVSAEAGQCHSRLFTTLLLRTLV